LETLGFMTINLDSENTYFTEIAKRASQQEMKCYRFIPSKIHPVSQMVTGQIYDSTLNEWEDSEFTIPNVLYDRCFYGDDIHSKQCASIVSWLKNREDIYFLGYGLPNKLELYNVLKQSTLLPYLPSTKPIISTNNVFEELKIHRKIVLKPINGSQGNGIYYIEYLSLPIKVKTFNRNQHIHKEFSDEKKFSAWIDTLITKRNYLLQPYLELTNEKKEPFDIRTLLQKKENGEWTERGRGLRVGHSDGIISNLNAGGRVENFEFWKNRLSYTQKEFVKAEVDDILNKIPVVLEEAFLPLFELGIDIGVAKDGSIWILDINSKPGRKVILETSPDKQDELYYAPIQFGKMLANLEDIGRKRYDAKTLSH
jgi:glutathione synthase/RimK-type ligase-like ATP-grasp enzyme